MKLEKMRQIMESADLAQYKADDTTDADLSYVVMACNEFPKLLALAEKAKAIRHSHLVYLEGMFPIGEKLVFDFLESVDRSEANE